MSNIVVRICAIICLFALATGEVAAQSPVFKVSSITADDAGGIYNGSNVSMTVVIKNTGVASGAFQAALNIPAGYAFVDSNPCGGTVQRISCRGDDPKGLFPGSVYTLLWTDGSDTMGSGNVLGAGGSSICSVRLTVGQVGGATGGQDIAQASVYNAPHNRCGTNSVDSKSYTFQTTSGPATDMAIGISTSKTTVPVGGTVDYTLTAANNGRQNSSSANVTFNFPTTLSVVPANCTGASTLGGNVITWAVGNVVYGDSATCVLRATVQSAGTGTATTTASVSLGSAMSDTNSANNTTSKTITLTAVAASADLAASISANKSMVSAGDAVTFTLTANNKGPQDATSTQLSTTFPSGITLTSATCSPNGAASSPLVWSIGTLTAGATQTCTVQASVTAIGSTSLTSTSTISSAVADPVTGNNTDSVTLSPQQMSQAANLAIHVTGPTAGHIYAPGDALSLTVTVQNTGLGAASGVVGTLHVPNNGDLTGLVSTCGVFDAAGNLTWAVGSVNGSSSKICTISATVAGGSRTIPVTVRVDSSNPGSDLSQLMDAVMVPVNPKPKRISVTTSGAPTTKDSKHVALSGDGSVAVFQSQEPNLVTGNSNTNGQDIYRVGSDGQPVLETMDGAGHQLQGTSSLPAVSGDGSVVAFSYTTAKSFGKAGITGAMWGGPSGQPKHQLDMGMGGAAPNGSTSGAPSVTTTSGGSKKLVYCSAASNIVNGDSNGANDVFVVDPTNPALPAQRISTDSSGAQLPGDSCEPKISADGTKVAFTISAPGLYGTAARQVVRKDLTTGTLEVMSTNGGAFANADSSEPSISGDGGVVAFTSAATNLDTLGAPVGGHEVFVSLGQNGENGTPRILKRARSADGIVPNGASQSAQLSNDGTVLVMQTLASNFFGGGKAQGTAACGAVAMSMNFFKPAALGSSMCNGTTSLETPAISGDGAVTGFDSNAPQAGSASSNNNAYLQGIAGLNSIGASAFGDDFSGQWFDSNQSGQGLVIDVLPPQADNSRIMSVIWFVYVNGQPTWVLGAGVPHAGSGADAGKVIVQMSQVGIYAGRSFPLGEASASASLWGSITLTFYDANTATMVWNSSRAGFNSGSMALTHFLPVGTPAQDLASAQVKACYSGNWKEPDKSGHGFEFEVIPASPPVLAVDWFAYAPNGSPVWLSGAGPISGNTAQMTLALIDGSGAQFPPKFNPAAINAHAWGTATFTFTDATHGHVTWNSTFQGYGQGSIDLVPTFGLERRGCH